MIKKSLLVLFAGFSCFIFSSSISETLPDPTVFSKKLIETLKQNNQDFYVQTFGIADADLDWLKKISTSSPYLTQHEKENIEADITNSSELKDKLKERLIRNFERFQDWAQSDSININNIEYLGFYYEIEFKKRAPFYVIDDGELFIKHGTKFYKISLDDVIFINNQWKYGEINSIEEVDEHLNYISEYESYSDYTVDSVAVVAEAVEYDPEVAYDTAAAAPYYEELYYPDLTEKQAKKAAKIQKKIDALNLQREKIYYGQ